MILEVRFLLTKEISAIFKTLYLALNKLYENFSREENWALREGGGEISQGSPHPCLYESLMYVIR